MTRLTYKEKSRSLALILFLLILLAVALSSCGVNHHLRKSQKHLKKAIAKGAIVSPDTVYKTITLYTPKIEVDTVLKNVHFLDTLVVEKNKVITRIKYDTISRTMFVSTECPPDTVKVRVPVIVNNEIKTPRGFWYYFKFIAIALMVGFILGAIFWAALRAWIKSFL